MAKVRSPGTLHKGQLPKTEQQMSLADEDARAHTVLDSLHRRSLFQGPQMAPTLPSFLRTTQTATVLRGNSPAHTQDAISLEGMHWASCDGFLDALLRQAKPQLWNAVPWPTKSSNITRRTSVGVPLVVNWFPESPGARAPHPEEKLRTWVECCPFTKGRSLGVRGFISL